MAKKETEQTPEVKPTSEMMTNQITARQIPYSFYIGPVALPQTIDDAEEQKGGKIYLEMMKIPPMQGVMLRVITQICQARPVFLPRHKPNPVGGDPDEESSEDIKLSQEICDFVKRCFEKLGEGTLENLMRESVENSLVRGHALAEMVLQYEKTGQDAGRVTIQSILVKPRENYAFVVDRANNVLGVQGIVPNKNYVIWNGPLFIDPEKLPGFVPKEMLFHFAFWPRYNDPSGRSILRAAYRPYLKYITGDAEDMKTAGAFGGGMLTLEADAEVPRVVAVGGKDVDVVEELSKVLPGMRNNGYMVLQPGWTLVRHEPKAGADFFDGYFRRAREGIAEAVTGAARAYIEAKFGSRADSTTAQEGSDIFSETVSYEWAASFRSQVVMRVVAVNYGEEVARKHCPIVTCNVPKTARIPEMSEAAKNLTEAGIITDNMKGEVAEKWFDLNYQDGPSTMATSPTPDVGDEAKKSVSKSKKDKKAGSGDVGLADS